MSARKNPNLFQASLIASTKDFKEQDVATVLAEVESNLRFMCLAMDAARFNAFSSGEESLETALGLLEAFYTFVDSQADTIRGVVQELHCFTLNELEALAQRRTAEEKAGQEAGPPPAASARRIGINAGELLRAGGFNNAFGEAVAPANVG